MIIAIDGPAGSGKSAVAKLIADKYHFFLLNSGYFYRAITYSVLQHQINLDDEEAILALARRSDIKVDEQHFYLNNKAIEEHLHDDSVSNAVAKVSSYAPLRSLLNEKMQAIAQERNLVCEGRDMTTVVFPNADLKIYLDASVQVRAKRRFEQGVSGLTLEQIEHSIAERDEKDKNKTEGALKIAKNAHYIDSSNLTLVEVCNKIEQMI